VSGRCVPIRTLGSSEETGRDPLIAAGIGLVVAGLGLVLYGFVTNVLVSSSNCCKIFATPGSRNP